MKTAQERVKNVLAETTNECSRFIKEKVAEKRKEIEALSKEELVNLAVKTYALNLAKSEEFKEKAKNSMSDAIGKDTIKYGSSITELVAKEKLSRHTIERILRLLQSYDPKAIDVIIANGIITRDNVDEITNKIVLD